MILRQFALISSLNGCEIDSSEAPSIIGEFTLSDGFGGYGYQFDGKGIFKRRDFGCLSNHVSDSGSYWFTGLWQLELTSKHQKAYFFVYRFNRFLFLVAQSKTELFKRQFVSFANVFYNAKPYALEDERYTDQFFIAFSLIKTHLTRLE